MAVLSLSSYDCVVIKSFYGRDIIVSFFKAVISLGHLYGYHVIGSYLWLISLGLFCGCDIIETFNDCDAFVAQNTESFDSGLFMAPVVTAVYIIQIYYKI